MGTSMSISMPELYSDWIQLQVLSGRTKTELAAGRPAVGQWGDLRVGGLVGEDRVGDDGHHRQD